MDLLLFNELLKNLIFFPITYQNWDKFQILDANWGQFIAKDLNLWSTSKFSGALKKRPNSLIWIGLTDTFSV